MVDAVDRDTFFVGRDTFLHGFSRASNSRDVRVVHRHHSPQATFKNIFDKNAAGRARGQQGVRARSSLCACPAGSARAQHSVRAHIVGRARAQEAVLALNSSCACLADRARAQQAVRAQEAMCLRGRPCARAGGLARAQQAVRARSRP